jgi:hypothetical protein
VKELLILGVVGIAAYAIVTSREQAAASSSSSSARTGGLLDEDLDESSPTTTAKRTRADKAGTALGIIGGIVTVVGNGIKTR